MRGNMSVLSREWTHLISFTTGSNFLQQHIPAWCHRQRAAVTQVLSPCTKGKGTVFILRPLPSLSVWMKYSTALWDLYKSLNAGGSVPAENWEKSKWQKKKKACCWAAWMLKAFNTIQDVSKLSALIRTSCFQRLIKKTNILFYKGRMSN